MGACRVGRAKDIPPVEEKGKGERTQHGHIHTYTPLCVCEGTKAFAIDKACLVLQSRERDMNQDRA